MPSQKTDNTTIENEKLLIRDVAGLSSVDEVKLNDRGWDSRVYSFGESRYFFKFPRSEKIQKQYQYEIAAIKFVNDLDTNIVAQKILWEHPDNAYFGYEGVQGAAVSEIIDKLTASQKAQIGESIGGFLRQFHQLKLSGARTMSIEDEALQIKRWYENCKDALKEWFDDKEQNHLYDLVYNGWPKRLTELGSESILCHGDLHFANILYGYDGSVGVIDFGDVAYYDRSKDFLELGEDMHIFDAVLRAYGQHSDNLKQKIAVRQNMIQIINLGVHIGKEDQANIKLTVDKIRAEL